MAAALAKKNQQIATIPMGYADGISRVGEWVVMIKD
jgi:alanine racemase